MVIVAVTIFNGENEEPSLCQRSLSLPLQRWMSSRVEDDEEEGVGDDWTAGYSDSEDVNHPEGMSVQLSPRNESLPGVI